MQRTEQERIRRESLAALRAHGIEPYPAAEFTVTHRSKRLAAEFKDGMAVTLAGRIMSRRIMGKASFAEIQDSEGTFQLYLNRDAAATVSRCYATTIGSCQVTLNCGGPLLRNI